MAGVTSGDSAPATTSLGDRLQLRVVTSLLVVGAPRPAGELLGDLPATLQLVEAEATPAAVAHAAASAEHVADGAAPFQGAVVFVRDASSLASVASAVVAAVDHDGLLWFCYPKLSGAITSDLTRDRGWEPVTRGGLRGVAQVAVDADWTATRYRPAPGD